MRHRRRIIASMAAAMPFLALLAIHAPASAQEPIPIEHVVVVMQEDRTFDNYFGTYNRVNPDARGWPDDFMMPIDPLAPDLGMVAPHKLEETRTPSLPHSEKAMRRAVAFGAMDGFIEAAEAYGATDGSLTMGYYDYHDIPFYWDLADNYVLADNWFSSVLGPSFPNHLYLFAATREGRDGTVYNSTPATGLDVLTIFDRLEAKGISWKMYIQGYDPDVNFRNTEARQGIGEKAAQLIWVPLVSIPRFVDDDALSRNLVPLGQYFIDADRGELPAVSFITPSGLSEHPPGDLTLGHYFATDLLEALMIGPQWDSSAFVITWDEWGGFADHVPPPQVDADGYGIRVPGLVVSPYAKRGFIDHTLYDHTSVLATIEWIWDLEPLAKRDAAANDLRNAFDFDQPARRPAILDPEYVPPGAPTEPPEPVEKVFAAYTAMLAIAGVGISSAVALDARRRRRGSL